MREGGSGLQGASPQGKEEGFQKEGEDMGWGWGGMQSRIGGSSSGSERASRMRGLGSLERALWDRKGPPPEGERDCLRRKGC